MQRAMVVGHATATAQHPSLAGVRLRLMQPLDTAGKPDGDPLLVVEPHGAGSASVCVVSSDGPYAREIVKDKRTPARWASLGVEDDGQQRRYGG